MSGFFDRLARRAAGGQPAQLAGQPGQLAVRAPQRYERAAAPARHGPGARAVSAPEPVVDALLDVARSALPEGGSEPDTGRVAARPPGSAPRTEGPGEAPRPRGAEPRRTSDGESAPSHSGSETHERPAPVEAAVASRPAHGRPVTRAVEEAAAGPRPAEPHRVVPEGVPAPERLPARPVDVGETVAPQPVAQVTWPDVAELARRHILPELRARGLAGVHERIEVVGAEPGAATSRDGSTTDAAAAGSTAVARRRGRSSPATTVTVAGARVEAPPAATPGAGPVARRRASGGPAAPHGPAPAPVTPPAAAPVQVHIDRVVVTRPAPAVPPAPSPPARPRPDHTTYLARRREGR